MDWILNPNSMKACWHLFVFTASASLVVFQQVRRGDEWSRWLKAIKVRKGDTGCVVTTLSISREKPHKHHLVSDGRFFNTFVGNDQDHSSRGLESSLNSLIAESVCASRGNNPPPNFKSMTSSELPFEQLQDISGGFSILSLFRG